jgi:hypothetical protein
VQKNRQKKVRRGLWKKMVDESQMAGTGNRQKFCQSLNQR